MKQRLVNALPWAYLILSSSWLFAPFVNTELASKLTLISEYEAVGQPWSWLFRLFDLVAAGIFLIGIWLLMQKKLPNVPRVVLKLLLIFGIGLVIDALFPVSCGAIRHFACIETHTDFWYVHAVESVITGSVIFVATGIMAQRRDRLAALAFFGQAVLGAYALLGFVVNHPPSTVLQMADQLVIALWLTRFLYVHLVPPRRSVLSPTLVTKVITIWVAFNGFAALLSSTLWRSVIHGRLGTIYFANDVTWLAEHSVVIGLALLYITRQLWRGEHRAWQIATVLVWIEVLKYAVIEPSPFLVVTYFAVGMVLLFEEQNFTRFSRFKYSDALQSIVLPLIGLLVLFASGVLFIYSRNPDALLDFTSVTGELTRHVFLIGPIVHHERFIRFTSRILRAGIGALLLLLLFSLFAPQHAEEISADPEEQKKFKELLKKHASSSEDSLKLWPKDKQYFWLKNQTSAIAYKVAGPVGFMLPDAIGPAHAKKPTTENFMRFCRSQGREACALNVPESSLKLYEDLGFKTIKIGASAVVDVKHFVDTTVGTKWWRWIMNRGKRQGWKYEIANAPYSAELIAELRYVSDAWLKRSGRVERTFALGYFAEDNLQTCRLHILRDADGKLIAFTNEIPIYNNLKITSIDLMRFLPELDGTVAFLLAETIKAFKAEGHYKKFDLGFVPLAAAEDRFDRAVAQAGRFLAGERVSAKGLEQFKNKFEPAWENSYLAFDGDWTDLIRIVGEIDNVLEIGVGLQ